MNQEITLPPKRERTQPLGVRLRVVTPIYGGAATPRTIDDVDIIRPASIRGHLRFWWRALFAFNHSSLDALVQAERTIWGGAAKNDDGGRSKVEIRVRVDPRTVAGRDPKPIPMGAPDGYALFPARGQAGGDDDPRRKPDTEFDLELKMPVDFAAVDQVRDALQAWILFGGYGGRTRRGLGSLTIVGASDLKLPSAASTDAIGALFTRSPFLHSAVPGPVPMLVGARLFSHPGANAIDAWTTAISWLREFRQGSSLSENLRARAPNGRDRPSRSNWPEADKVRRLSVPGKLPWAHPPRHNEVPAWPRAGFGLPILGQFQKKNRSGQRWQDASPPSTEPNEQFEIGWYDDGQGFHDRLASPLILKPLALTDGKFAAVALWLNRAFPKGNVGLRGNRKSMAPFDQLIAPGDVCHFQPLVGKRSLQDAFFDWVIVASKELNRPTSQPKPNRPQKYRRPK